MSNQFLFFKISVAVVTALAATAALGGPCAADTAPSLVPATATEIPLPPPTQTLTLPQCLRAVLVSNDTAQRFHFSQDKVERAVALAETALRPTVTASLRAAAKSQEDVLSPGGDQILFTRERARAGLTVSYPLYDAGRRADQLHVARDVLLQTQYAAQAEKVVLLEQVTSAFFHVLQGQRALEAGRQLSQVAEENLAAAQARLSAGAVTRGDVLAAQSAVSLGQADENQQRADLIGSRAELARLLEEDPMVVVLAVTEPAAEIPLATTTEQMVTLDLQNNPRRKSLLIGQNAARAQLSFIRAERAPIVTLQGSAGCVVRDIGGASVHPYLLVTMELSVPLFERPAQRAREQNQLDELQLGDVALRDFDRQLKTDIVTSSGHYWAGVAEVAARSDALQAAEEARRLAAARYTVGRGTQLEVLDAMARLTVVRNALIEARNAQDIAAERLRRATGLEALPK